MIKRTFYSPVRPGCLGRPLGGRCGRTRGSQSKRKREYERQGTDGHIKHRFYGVMVKTLRSREQHDRAVMGRSPPDQTFPLSRT